MPKQNPLVRTETLAKRKAVGKGYQVWRGRYKGFFNPKEQMFECVLVGLPDGNNPPPTSVIVLAVNFSHSGGCWIKSDNYIAFISEDPWNSILKELDNLPNMKS